ncbi:N-acetylglucosamine-6-phosphate deacetylase [Marinivivus vitaminiproducens]|uniref:N-acetylglucosamine-6-phosphate deacetylase n=1 Tax=Marinivivus vitaminiproducens TaxID=3035935 RepID=UPI0027A32778|nr:N-acetylglucosamine-6-phosphate deacetylase [Geminicoccaceae bacterium SCSIO 64248]
MSERHAFVGADIFDGERRVAGHALLIADGRVEAICGTGETPLDATVVRCEGGLLAPGFIDIQVNGGGGVLFNDEPTVDGIARICAAHARFGATSLLPTVITDRPEVMAAAIEAVAEATCIGVAGCLGIHVEGPFIAIARKGAHEAGLIRRMTGPDLEMLCATAVRPFVLTLAPESVSNAQIARLAGAGIHVSIGHSDADHATARAAFAAGARGVTHLFNAMSPLGHRSPGLVGATLECGDVWAGIIADGHHVHPTALALALRAKSGPGRLMAISDAMPTVGIDSDTFTLNGRRVVRRDGRLVLADGTLAGSDLTMIGAVRYLVRTIGLPIEEALRMSALYPARYLGIEATRGALTPGAWADIVWLSDGLDVEAVWIEGRLRVDRSGALGVPV